MRVFPTLLTAAMCTAPIAAQRLKSCALVGLLLCTLGARGEAQASTPVAQPLPSVTLPSALDRVLRDYEQAWRTGNVAALVALFTPDGFVLQPGRPPARGHDALTKAYAGLGGGSLRLRALSYATADGIGYIIGAYAYGDNSTDMGKFTLTLRRQASGRWLIASDMDNGSQAPVLTNTPATMVPSVCADSGSAFRRVVSEFQSRQQNAAISVGVLHNGRSVFREASGFANLETRAPAEASMAFSIASITKAFTGAAMLKLVEAGRIELDAEVQRYVPDFPRHPSGRPVTLRMLAHHLGAVRHWGAERNDAVYARHFDDVHDILDLVRNDPWVPDLAPLTRYAYSSYGYNVLGMAMQRAAGTTFQQWLREEILQPLALTSVQFDRPGLGGTRRPVRYSWYDLGDFHELDSAPQRVPDWDYSHNLAGGGLIANVEDLLTFGRAMRAPGLLSSASIALIWTPPAIQGIESRMTFGWSPRDNPRRISSSGSNAGVQAGLTVWKDVDLVVAVLASSWGRGSRSGELMDDGANGLIGRLAAVCGAR